jgi:inhibitor of KinA
LTVEKLTYKPFGDRAILIEWPAKIDEKTLNNVLNYKYTIQKNSIKVIVDIISTYNSLTIFYLTTIEKIDNEILALKAIYSAQHSSKITENYLWKIPVCYDQKFGLDLEEISQKNGLPIDQIIEMHSGQIYTVYFIGFLPGFLYLGGLDKKLHFQRKSNPRLVVEKGAVGIGGSQTGVYPQESAGGWNIIGNSPIQLFDRKKEHPCFAHPGDKVQFIPIDIKSHEEIANLVAYKRYHIESEELDA